MSGENGRALREWFAAACDLPEGEWEAFLAEHCDDPAMRAEVLDLLRRDRADELPLDEPVLSPTQRRALTALNDTSFPEAIDDYRVVRMIGRGSMGTVYEARQPSTGVPVAVKVLRTGVPSAALLARFRREAELLARLDHPYIARIHDTGTADLGPGAHPYIAMELVEGLPLDEYAEREELTDRDRLELLAKIADGVQHAHERGIVHRDLKPSNVLVDGAGRPRLIDFGVARALSVDQDAGSLVTATGQLVGTLQYMSPEQVGASRREVDARADVYSLGVIGYELLAGRAPYDVTHCALSDALERIQSSDPVHLGAVRPELRGDVEAIFARALEKDPERRYPSAQAFADDLRNALASRPVVARTPSVFDQLRRFRERNPRVVRAGAAFVGVLLLGIVGTSWGWREAWAKGETVGDLLAEQVELTAEAEAARERVSDLLDEQVELTRQAEDARREMQGALRESQVALEFVEDMFENMGHGEKGPEVRVRDVLLPASVYVDEHYANDPEIAVRLHYMVGTGLWSSAEHELALKHLDEVERLVGDPTDRRVVKARIIRAQVFMDQGRFDDAVLEFTAARDAVPVETERSFRADIAGRLARAYKLGGDPDSADRVLVEAWGEDDGAGLNAHARANILVERATIAAIRGHYEAAEADLLAALAERRERLGPDHVGTLEVGEHLAGIYIDQRRFDEAEPYLRHRAEVLIETAGPEHTQTLHARGRIAYLLVESQRLAEALELLDELYPVSRRALGEEHPRTAAFLTSLSVAALSTGREDGAALTEQALELGRRVHGPDHPALLPSIINLTYLRFVQGRFDDAIEVAREGIAICDRNPGVSRMDAMLLASNLSSLLLATERYPEAEKVALATLDEAVVSLGEHHQLSVSLVAAAGISCRGQERWEEALSWFDRFVELDPELQHPDWPEVERAIEETLDGLAATGG